MNYSKEPWRKLYRREPNDHLAWPLLARGIRDLLIRFAEDDGTLLKKCSDPIDGLKRMLGVGHVPGQSGDMSRDTNGTVRDTVAEAIQLLIDDGFLVHDRSGRLHVRNFAEAQEARSAAAKKKAAQRAKAKESKQKKPSPDRGTSGGQSPDMSGDTQGDIEGQKADSRAEEKRGEEKREEEVGGNNGADEPPDSMVPCPADLRLADAQIANLEINMGIPRRAVDRFTVDFVGRYLGKPKTRRTLDRWRAGLHSSLTKDWGVPEVRKRLMADEPAGDPQDEYQVI